MLKDIVEARPLGQHRLFLRFEDGIEGEIEIAKMVEFTGILALLADATFFDLVTADPETGTITLPNSAGLDPDVLYAALSGSPSSGASLRQKSVVNERSVANG
jgi:hypothetical protein